MISRRAVLAAPLAVPALGALGGLSPLRAQAPGEVVLSAFGIGQDQFRRHLYEPFERANGIKVTVEVGNVSDRLARLEARRADPNIDLAALTDAAAYEAGQKGLLEAVDTGKLANFAKVFDFAKDPIGGGLGIGYTFYSTSIVYRTDKVQKMDSWLDLFQPALKGRIALPAITTSQAPLTLMMIERAQGGSSPHFAGAIDTVARNRDGIVTFYTGGAQVTQLFQQDEIWAAPVGRFSWGNLRRTGVPLGWAALSEGLTGGINVLCPVKGSRRLDAAHRLIDAWLSADAQRALGQDLVDSPVNRDVRLTGDAAEIMSDGTGIADKLVLLGPAQALANRDAWLSDWNRKVAG